MPNLLFDYDGTLHDSMKIYAPSVQLAWDRLAAKGLTEPRTLSEEELRPCIGMTPDEMWGYFAMNIGEEEKRECTKLVGDNMLELVRRGEAKLYDGVPEALAELRRRGFHLVLLSNCPFRISKLTRNSSTWSNISRASIAPKSLATGPSTRYSSACAGITPAPSPWWATGGTTWRPRSAAASPP